VWPFGKKIVCFHCDAKVKEKESRFRRGFRFCSDACVAAFLQANPLKPRRDVAESDYQRQAATELAIAVSELNRMLGSEAVRFTGGASLLVGSIAAAQAMQALEDAKDAVHHFNTHVTNALPFLYALGRQSEIEYLECIDFESIQDRSTLGAGPLQQASIRKQVRPVAERVAAMADALS